MSSADPATLVLGAVVAAAALMRGTSAVLALLARLSTRATRRLAEGSRRTGARGLLAAVAGSLAAALPAAAHAAPAPVGATVPAEGPDAPRQVSPGTSIARTSSATGEVHVVRPGECLWALAADRLGPAATDAEIAAEWPRWYRLNRSTIGSNPSRLLVGTHLRVPSGRRTGTSAPSHHSPATSGHGPDAQSLDPDRR